MAAKCSPPKGQSVKAHTRSRPRGKHKPASYWTCELHGKGCGMHHRSQLTALRHSRRLDAAARKQGRRVDWQPRKVG